MRVLVCGDRNWTDEDGIRRVLKGLIEPLVVIHGGARGADSLAGKVAEELGHEVEVYPADWQRYGKAAGVLRNQQMLDEGKPDFVLAFHADLSRSKGTADMVRRAVAAGITVVPIVEVTKLQVFDRKE